MAVTVSTSGTSVTFCNGYGYTVDINVTYTGSSTTYKLITLRRGGCSTQTFPVGNFSYGVYEDFYGGSTRLERGDFVVSSGSGGGGDSGGDEEEYTSPPSIYSITAANATYADNILKFEFEANLRNPNSDILYARYQCKFGNGSTTYYAPYYDGSGTKPARGLDPGIGNYMKCFSTSYNSTISYAYYPSTTVPGTYTVTIPVYISLYYAEYLNDISITQTAFTNRQFNLTIEYTIEESYDDFFWADGTTTISPGDTFTNKIDASTWLDLISKVNKLKGTNISTSGVSSGSKFTATHYNNVANALGVATVSSGADCDAKLFNALRNAYRS